MVTTIQYTLPGRRRRWFRCLFRIKLMLLTVGLAAKSLVPLGLVEDSTAKWLTFSVDILLAVVTGLYGFV